MNIATYIISLDINSNKTQNIKNQCIENNLAPYIIEAINGKSLKAIDYFNQSRCLNSKFKGRKYLTPSELGCLLSHKKTLIQFINSEYDTAIILEDDVTFNKKITKKIITNIELKSNSGIIILGGQNGLSSFSRIIKYKDNISDIFRISSLSTRWIYRTCCYSLNKDNAKDIIRNLNNYSYFADDWKLILDKTNIKNLYYFDLFSHPLDLSSSSIENERKILDRY